MLTAALLLHLILPVVVSPPPSSREKPVLPWLHLFMVSTTGLWFGLFQCAEIHCYYLCICFPASKIMLLCLFVFVFPHMHGFFFNPFIFFLMEYTGKVNLDASVQSSILTQRSLLLFLEILPTLTSQWPRSSYRTWAAWPSHLRLKGCPLSTDGQCSAPMVTWAFSGLSAVSPCAVPHNFRTVLSAHLQCFEIITGNEF